MEHIQKFVNSLGGLFRREFAGILLITLLFLFFPLMVRKIDITAAAIDPGVLSAIILAIVAVLVFKASTWWLIKAIWPGLAEYSDFRFNSNFNRLEPRHKVLIFLGFYLAVFFGFISALAAFI